MDNRSIGVFDSGLGGLTAVREIMARLPHENIVYFGDTGGVPYGPKAADTIIKYSHQDIRFLESFGVKMIVIACGTVSSVALPVLRGMYQTPLIGVIDATAAAAAYASRNKKIGIIGTQGTIKSQAYERALETIDSEIQTYSVACPLFVPLVENGHIDTQVTRLVAEEYLADLRKENIDALILGCTHYPHLKKVIAETMGNCVELIDPGAEVAKFLERELAQKGLHSDAVDPEQYRYFVSDTAEGFEELGSLFLHRDIRGKVKKIDIEKYEEKC